MKISDNFDVRELVHPDIFNTCKERCKDFINPNLPLTLETLKTLLTEKLDNEVEAITINSWLWGGGFVDSGLRHPKGNVGASLSAHRFGTACDCKFKHHTIKEVYDFILGNQSLFPHIIRMENIKATPTWIHLEVSTGKREGEIYVFNP